MISSVSAFRPGSGVPYGTGNNKYILVIQLFKNISELHVALDSNTWVRTTIQSKLFCADCPLARCNFHSFKLPPGSSSHQPNNSNIRHQLPEIMSASDSHRDVGSYNITTIQIT
jgi:hypothetical protein